MPETVAVIGLGLLGAALAERLMARGFGIVGFDADPGCLSAAARLGLQPAPDVAGAARAARRILLSLPDSTVVQQVLASLAGELAPGQVVIDTTTGDPESMAAVGRSLDGRGIDYLDATVAGSSALARRGEVVIMAGGRAGAFEACRDLFDAFARQAFHVGGWGSGARMKLVVNLVLGLNRAALAEGLALAARWELDLQQVLAVLKSGAAYSRAMDAKGLKMIAGEFSPEAKLSQHLKDVELILSAGDRSGANLPLSAIHRELLQQAVSAGHGNDDNSAIIRVFQQTGKT